MLKLILMMEGCFLTLCHLHSERDAQRQECGDYREALSCAGQYCDSFSLSAWAWQSPILTAPVNLLLHWDLHINYCGGEMKKCCHFSIHCICNHCILGWISAFKRKMDQMLQKRMQFIAVYLHCCLLIQRSFSALLSSHSKSSRWYFKNTQTCCKY